MIVSWMNRIGILLVCFSLLGALWFQWNFEHAPCSLCLIQKLCFSGIGASYLLNLKFGDNIFHYVLSLWFAFLGYSLAVRTFSGEHLFWGLGLPVWSSFIFFGCFMFSLILLVLISNKRELSWDWKEKGLSCLLGITIAASAYTSL